MTKKPKTAACAICGTRRHAENLTLAWMYYITPRDSGWPELICYGMPEARGCMDSYELQYREGSCRLMDIPVQWLAGKNGQWRADELRYGRSWVDFDDLTKALRAVERLTGADLGSKVGKARQSFVRKLMRDGKPLRDAKLIAARYWTLDRVWGDQ